MKALGPTDYPHVEGDARWTMARAKATQIRLRSVLRAFWIPMIGVCFSLIGPSGLLAGSLEAGGLSFSDELGGFRLISATGSGRGSDPIILVEEIFGMGPAVLTIRQSG